MDGNDLTPEQLRLLTEARGLSRDPVQDARDTRAASTTKALVQGMNELTNALNTSAEKIKPKGFMGWLIR
jgi:hypothetical protein